ncbi:hypothetical protein K3495_g5985 [Podosphaera aphanis]|nr:hypothetical protein K3495_g5985 [Podosphaera aphanis]
MQVTDFDDFVLKASLIKSLNRERPNFAQKLSPIHLEAVEQLLDIDLHPYDVDSVEFWSQIPGNWRNKYSKPILIADQLVNQSEDICRVGRELRRSPSPRITEFTHKRRRITTSPSGPIRVPSIEEEKAEKVVDKEDVENAINSIDNLHIRSDIDTAGSIDRPNLQSSIENVAAILSPPRSLPDLKSDSLSFNIHQQVQVTETRQEVQPISQFSKPAPLSPKMAHENLFNKAQQRSIQDIVSLIIREEFATMRAQNTGIHMKCETSDSSLPSSMKKEIVDDGLAVAIAHAMTGSNKLTTKSSEVVKTGRDILKVKQQIDTCLRGEAALWWNTRLDDVRCDGLMLSNSMDTLIKALVTRFKPPPSEAFDRYNRTRYSVDDYRNRKSITTYIATLESAAKACGQVDSNDDTKFDVVIQAWMHLDQPLRETVDEPAHGTTLEQFTNTILRKQPNWFDKFPPRGTGGNQ